MRRQPSLRAAIWLALLRVGPQARERIVSGVTDGRRSLLGLRSA
jgi:hypothetical protein